MDWIKTIILTALFTASIIDLNTPAMAADRGNCRRGDKIQIQDLDMSPDPVIEGQRVRAWKLRVRYDGQGECSTAMYVREGNNIAGTLRNHTLRSGLNEIEIPASEGFRFRGKETCFNVQVDVDGSRHQIDAERRFCAKQRTVWSMREAEDRGPIRK